MSMITTDTGSLERRIADIAGAAKPAEVLRALLDASQLGAPRIAVFLARQGGLKGWGSRGYPDEPSRRLRGVMLEPNAVWLGRVGDADGVATRGADEPVPDFGQPLAIEAIALPLRVGGRAMAVLMAERSEDDPELSAEILQILVHVARLRLELDVALRRQQDKAPASRPAAPAPVSEARVSPAPVLTAAPPAAPAAEERTELEPVPQPGEGDPDDPRTKEARTFARLVATDIRLYNEEAIMLGRRNRDLADRLSDHLKRGQDSFLRRFPDLGHDGLALLREAYVQVLGGGDTSLFPPEPLH